MTCRARWEPPWKPSVEQGGVWMCAGSIYTPLPCEDHWCGMVLPLGRLLLNTLCRCPVPA